MAGDIMSAGAILKITNIGFFSDTSDENIQPDRVIFPRRRSGRGDAYGSETPSHHSRFRSASLRMAFANECQYCFLSVFLCKGLNGIPCWWILSKPDKLERASRTALAWVRELFPYKSKRWTKRVGSAAAGDAGD